MPAAIPPQPLDPTEEALLEAGLALIREKGVRKMTVEEAVRQVGVGKRTLYRLYPTKEAFALVCIILEGYGRSESFGRIRSALQYSAPLLSFDAPPAPQPPGAAGQRPNRQPHGHQSAVTQREPHRGCFASTWLMV